MPENTFVGLHFVYLVLCYRDISARGISTCTANRIYAYSAEASLNGNVFAQPYQNDTVRIRQRSGVSAEFYREKRYHLSSAYNKYQNQTAQQIKFVFITHFIHIHVCMHKQIRRCKKRRLNRVLLLADRKVINTCTKLQQFRSVN